MVSKNTIKKIYNDKIKLLDRYNKYYYEKQKPLVSDKEFDILKKEILELESKYDYKNPISPSIKVGFKPSKKFEKYKHRVKMLSLSNAFNKEDLVNFQKNINF